MHVLILICFVQYVLENPAVTRLQVEEGSRAFSFKTDLKKTREMVVNHPMYAPHFKIVPQSDGTKILVELIAEDGTNEGAVPVLPASLSC